jgi:heat-inducible transcriptional repressor
MEQSGSLNPREELILQAIVHCYITTAEPVGSRVIVKRFGLELSPATVRNVMSDLEEAGYLQQLHTSSGRVPTDRGYRYYVDYLMHVQNLTLAERSRIDGELSSRLNDADDVLRQTSQLLALVTHQTGIVQPPDVGNAKLQHIEVTAISPTRAAVLLVDSLGRVQTYIAPLSEALRAEELPKLTSFLNESLRYASLDQLAARVHLAMRAFLDERRRLAESALHLLDLLPPYRPGRLYLEGASQLFEQPEFQDVEKVREVFGVLDEQGKLTDLLRRGLREREYSGASVVIGSEACDPGLKEISVVSSPYHVGGERVGVVGVLGPRRMHYSKLTAIVDYTAEMLGKLLTRLAG